MDTASSLPSRQQMQSRCFAREGVTRGEVCAWLLAAVLVLVGPGGSPLRGRDSTGVRTFCRSLVHPLLKTCSSVPAGMF